MEKPYPDFPLTPNSRNGQWVKKIKGWVYSFGKLADWRTALERYHRERPDLEAGRKPRPAPEEITLDILIELFLDAKQAEVDSGEMTARSMADCKQYFSTPLDIGNFSINMLEKFDLFVGFSMNFSAIIIVAVQIIGGTGPPS